jgi:hypothetical protein
MTAETQHFLNQNAVESQVSIALHRWMQKHPDHTPDQIIAVSANLRDKITNSRLKDKFQNSKVNRAVRKAAIAEEVAKHGLEFSTVQETVFVERKQQEQEAGRNIFEAFLDDLLCATIPEIATRTVTFVFKKTKLGKAFKIDYAVALQNPADTADYLVAKEYAVARLLNGQVLTVYVTDADKMQYSDMAKSLVNHNAHEVYSAAYL